MQTQPSDISRRSRLIEVAALFLRLGFTAFGGPAAHIAIMRDEVVKKRKWVTEQEFLDLFGAANMIPGPTSTEMAIYLGYRRVGWMGLVLAGVCFILPAMLIVMILSWAYIRLWHNALGKRHALRHHAGGDGDHRSSVMGIGNEGDQELADWRHRSYVQLSFTCSA